MPRYQAVCFDLDGTLVDTAADLAAAVNELRAGYGLPALPVPEVVSFVGNGAGLLVTRSLAGSGVPLDEARARFPACYDRHLVEASAPYPGIVDMLARLAAAGVRLGVATNKPHRQAVALLAGLGMDRFFAGKAAVLGADAARPLKPDPAMLREVMAALGAPAAATLYVGDDAVDVAAARAAGMEAALVTWGMGKPGAAPPDHTVSTPAALADLVLAGPVPAGEAPGA